MKKTILITSGRSPAGLDLSRTFSKYGHRVIIVESFPFHLCQFSRFGKTYRVPSPSENPEEYIARIRNIVLKESVDLVIPVYEEIFPLSFFREQIPCRVLADDFELLRQLHSKYEFIKLCQEAGCTFPTTELIHSIEEIENLSDKVIKPVYSRFGTGVFIKPTRETVNAMDLKEPCVLQDYVEGNLYCGFCLVKDGEVLLQSVYPVETTLSGVCITFQHEPVPEIIEWMAQFVQHIEFTGSIGFDFVLKDGRVYPVECNPRVTSGVHLYSGKRSVVQAYLDEKPFVETKRCKSMAGPFVFSRALIKWSLWKKWFSSKDVIFNWSDPLPLLGLVVVYGYLRVFAWRKRMPMSEASSLDIEFNGQEYKTDICSLEKEQVQ